MSLVIPPNKKAGCLFRKTRIGEKCRLVRDAFDVIPQADWKPLIGKIDLREFVPAVLDQDGVGSCATEATSSAIHIARAYQGLPFVQLNPWTIYCYTSGGRDRGSSIDENLEWALEHGVCPDEVWPRYDAAGNVVHSWNDKPTNHAREAALGYRIAEYFDISTIDEIGTALLLGFPVVYGWSGHSCVLTSLKSATEAEYLNSWDYSWGDRGFGRIKLSQVDFRYGAFAVRTTTDEGILMGTGLSGSTTSSKESDSCRTKN